MSQRGSSTKAFKACMKCRALVPMETQACPVCGSTEFSTEWSGIIIVVDPEKSDVAKFLNIRVAGRYALKVGT